MSDPAVPTPPPAAPNVEPEGAKPADDTLGAPGLAALKAERDARAAAEKSAAEALAKLKEIEDRDKTEAQKTQEALEKAQRELADVTLAKTRAEVAASKGVPAALLVGQTQTELEASADALLEYKGQPRMVVPNEGRTPILSGSTADAFAAFAEKHLS